MKTKINKLYFILCSSLLSSSIFIVGAQVPTIPNNNNNNNTKIGTQLNDILVTGQGLLSTIYGSMFVLSLILFFFGLFRYLLEKDADKRKAGWNYMAFGIVIITLMSAIYGIVYFLAGSFGIGIGGTAPMPEPPRSRANFQ
jgi:hypothetical protein